MSAQPCHVNHLDEATVVTLAERVLDEGTTPAVFEGLRRLSAPPPRELVLDLHNVELATSVALGALLALRKRLQEAGARLVLCNARPCVYEALEVTKLTSLIEVHRQGVPSVRQAS